MLTNRVMAVRRLPRTTHRDGGASWRDHGGAARRPRPPSRPPPPPAAVTAGFSHTCAIDTDGTLWCWGENGWATGRRDDDQRTTPVRVGETTTWATIAAAGDHTCALRTDATLWCWGNNGFGQLGDGTTTNRTTPVTVGETTTWTTITADGDHTCALRTDATLWCWGYNENGQLGDGTTTNRAVPTQIGGTAIWATVASGSVHTCALRTDATSGAGATTDSDSSATAQPPTGPPRYGSAKPPPGPPSRPGESNVCALRTDATLWCWGNNQRGQLGDTTRSTRTTPVPVAGAATWTSVSTGAVTPAHFARRHPLVLGLEPRRNRSATARPPTGPPQHRSSKPAPGPASRPAPATPAPSKPMPPSGAGRELGRSTRRRPPRPAGPPPCG